MVLIAGLAAVRADTITFTNALTADSAVLPQFDPAQGQLFEVDLGFTGTLSVLGNLVNPTAKDYDVNVYYNFGYTISVSGTGLQTHDVLYEMHAPGVFVPASSSAMWSVDLNTSCLTMNDDLAADLNYFTGTGYVTALMFPSDMQNNQFAEIDGIWSDPITPGGPVTGSLSSADFSDGTVYLSYDYVVPEPTTMALAGVGGLSLLLFLRRNSPR